MEVLMMAYGIPVCSSSLACCLSLLMSDYADKTILAAAQDQVRGLDLQNAFFSVKKKNCKFLPRAVFLTCFTAFPHKQLSWQSYRGTVLQLGNQEKSRGWNETAIPPAITATGDKTLQPYILLLAWLGLSGTLESYLALLHLSASISDAVKWNHQWSPNLVKI